MRAARLVNLEEHLELRGLRPPAAPPTPRGAPLPTGVAVRAALRFCFLSSRSSCRCQHMIYYTLYNIKLIKKVIN